MSLKIIEAVKKRRTEAGISLAGACGAFGIINEVAHILNAGATSDDHGRLPWGLLRKAGGNRAVPQENGSCLDGDHSNQPGFATDYLIQRGTWLGYDVLSDGGGANGAQWPDGAPGTDNGPEIGQEQRNRENFSNPVGEAGVPVPIPVPNPTPTPVPTPVPTPTPIPSPDLAALTAKVQQLEAALVLERDANDALTIRVDALEQDHGDDTSDLVKRIVKLEARKVPSGVRSTLSWNGVASRLTYD